MPVSAHHEHEAGLSVGFAILARRARPPACPAAGSLAPMGCLQLRTRDIDTSSSDPSDLLTCSRRTRRVGGVEAEGELPATTRLGGVIRRATCWVLDAGTTMPSQTG